MRSGVLVSLLSFIARDGYPPSIRRSTQLGSRLFQRRPAPQTRELREPCRVQRCLSSHSAMLKECQGNASSSGWILPLPSRA